MSRYPQETYHLKDSNVVEASLNNRFIKHLMDLKQLEALVTRSTPNPVNKPGDTPEARFQAKLHVCKEAYPVNPLKKKHRFITDVWPKLERLSYSRAQVDDFGRYCANDFGDDFGDDSDNDFGEDSDNEYNDSNGDDFDHDYENDFGHHFDYGYVYV
ncbi:hypothetical protein BGZ67_001520 [Mortierella alpina]|nr:hypothetical protein BGZ67_001520 [Mortierella alpina]